MTLVMCPRNFSKALAPRKVFVDPVTREQLRVVTFLPGQPVELSELEFDQAQDEIASKTLVRCKVVDFRQPVVGLPEDWPANFRALLIDPKTKESHGFIEFEPGCPREITEKELAMLQNDIGKALILCKSNPEEVLAVPV